MEWVTLNALAKRKDGADRMRADLNGAGIPSRLRFAGRDWFDVAVKRTDWHRADRLIYGSHFHAACKAGQSCRA